MTTDAERIAALEEALAQRDAQLTEVLAAAEASQDKLRKIMEALPVGVALISADGIVTEASDTYIGLLPGATRENTVGHSVLQRVQTVAAGRFDPETGEKFSEADQSAWLNLRLAQYRDPNMVPDVTEYRLPNGSHLRTVSRRAADGSLVQITQDIAEIRSDEERLRRAIEMLPAAICFFDANKKLIAFNQHFREGFRPDHRAHCRLGASYQEIAELLLRSCVHFETADAEPRTYSDLTDEEIQRLAYERTTLVGSRSDPVLAEYRNWDGRIYRSRAVQTPEGGAVRVAVDVTAERRMTQRFADVVDSLDEAVFLFDHELKLRLWSPATLAMLPFLAPLLREGVDAKTIRDAVRFAAIEEDRFEVVGTEARTYHRRLLDGRTLELRCLPTREGGLLVACSDQTSLRKASQLASRAERMASLGRLVAGVAHEINTPLGIAITTASYFNDQTRKLTNDFESDGLTRSGLGAYLKTAGEAGGLLMRNLVRAGDLVSSFKRVSVDELSGEHRRFELSDVFEDAAVMLRPQLRSRGHELRIDCPDKLVLNSYPAAFNQIVTNFVMNSVIHGYPEGRAGVLELSARRIERGVEIRYRDDGVGVAPEDLGRIFEHFFTTRRGQGGSGLGLAIVHNLVTHQLGGDIEAINRPGAGLEFRVVAPETVSPGVSELSWE